MSPGAQNILKLDYCRQELNYFYSLNCIEILHIGRIRHKEDGSENTNSLRLLGNDLWAFANLLIGEAFPYRVCHFAILWSRFPPLFFDLVGLQLQTLRHFHSKFSRFILKYVFIIFRPAFGQPAEDSYPFSRFIDIIKLIR